MEENNNSGSQPSGDSSSPREKKAVNAIGIVGYNILALVFYTLLFKLVANDGGMFLDAFVLFIHVIFCLGMSIGKRSGWWLLSSLLVLIIGFSTCVAIGFNLNMH
ncbi:MAG TPA: hypothetical protein VGN20_15215 [Mucilaginibacter sp.]|jgi:hypothetical protein